MVLVSPRMWPDTTDTAPNSPMARALQSSTPYNRPHLMLGRVTRKKVCRPDAPSEIAAASSSVPCSCISGISARATNGNVTKMVASAMPGTANSTWTLWLCSHGPQYPCAPNSSTKTRPEITGLTENGKSISEIRKVLPRKSNLAIAQAATTPNTRLRPTEIAATLSVSLIADSASGSDSAEKYAPTPLENACANTMTSGSTTKTVRKITAMVMMTMRISLGSVRRSSRAELKEDCGAFIRIANVSTAAVRSLSLWERSTRLVAAAAPNSWIDL